MVVNLLPVAERRLEERGVLEAGAREYAQKGASPRRREDTRSAGPCITVGQIRGGRRAGQHIELCGGLDKFVSVG